MNLAAAMVSPWVAIPLAGIGMVLMAGYTLGIQRQDVPPVRRRLRTAMGVLHIFLLAAFTYGVSIATPADRKAFVMVWVVVVGLVAASVLLALADAAFTVRLALRERRDQNKQDAKAIAQAVLQERARRETDKDGATP